MVEITLKRINQASESPLGSAASPLRDLAPGSLVPQFPLLPRWHLGRQRGPSACLIWAGGWQMAGEEPSEGAVLLGAAQAPS